MRDFFSTYWLYIKTFFKSRIEYRFGFFCALFANFYCYFVTYLSVWVIVNSVSTIGGWDFQDISFLFGLNLLSSSISAALLWYTVFNLSGIVTGGGLDIYLVRPEGVMKQLIWQRFGDTALAQILVSIIFLVSAFVIRIQIFNIFKIIYLILAIIGGVMIQCGAMIFVGSISFWTYRSSEIGSTVYYDLRSMIQYPLSIYPRWIKYILTFVFPWAFINYYPSLLLLNKAENVYDMLLGVIAPMVGFIFLKLSLFTFNKGLKRYSGAGN